MSARISERLWTGILSGARDRIERAESLEKLAKTRLDILELPPDPGSGPAHDAFVAHALIAAAIKEAREAVPKIERCVDFLVHVRNDLDRMRDTAKEIQEELDLSATRLGIAAEILQDKSVVEREYLQVALVLAHHARSDVAGIFDLFADEVFAGRLETLQFLSALGKNRTVEANVTKNFNLLLEERYRAFPGKRWLGVPDSAFVEQITREVEIGRKPCPSGGAPTQTSSIKGIPLMELVSVFALAVSEGTPVKGNSKALGLRLDSEDLNKTIRNSLKAWLRQRGRGPRQNTKNPVDPPREPARIEAVYEDEIHGQRVTVKRFTTVAPPPGGPAGPSQIRRTFVGLDEVAIPAIRGTEFEISMREKAALHAALQDQISPELRDRFLNEVSDEELAKRAGVCPSTIRTRRQVELERLRQSLREYLSPERDDSEDEAIAWHWRDFF